MKPGKPLWFGVREARDERQTLVFGLPGNPVSTLVSFKLFVEPALAALAGAEFAAPATQRGVAGRDVQASRQAADVSSVPVDCDDRRRRRCVVEPLDWQGSADLATLTRADCLAVLPAGDYELAAGDAG